MFFLVVRPTPSVLLAPKHWRLSVKNHPPFQVPHDADVVLFIDSETQEMTSVELPNELLEVPNQRWSTALVVDGNVYAAPYGSNLVLKVTVNSQVKPAHLPLLCVLLMRS